MIELINDFANLFRTSTHLNENLVVKQQNRYFLLTETLKKLASRGFSYAGTYLGQTASGKFFPSLELLRMMAKEKANNVVVDKRTEWLFICGRDVFKQGIIKVGGSCKRGDYVLILNRHGECLGYGRVVGDLSKGKGRMVIQNILDIGDFLRREREEP